MNRHQQDSEESDSYSSPVPQRYQDNTHTHKLALFTGKVQWRLLKAFCYSHRSVSDCPHWQASSCGNCHRNPHLDGVQDVGDLGTLGPKWYVFIKPLRSQLRKLCGRGGRKMYKPQGWITLRKVSSRHNRTMNMWTHRECGSTHRVCTDPNQIEFQCRDGKVDMTFHPHRRS